MKLLLINGSPKGEKSTCAVMLSSLVRNMQNSCEMIAVNLAEKEIQSCKGCYACWSRSNGCVIEDDFADIIQSAENTDIIIFATPVYFGNVSGLLKNFIDRLTSTGGPKAEVKIGAPKFIMMSNCGFPSEKEFEVISLWINKFVNNMKSELLGEFYYPNGKRLRDSSDKEAMEYLLRLSTEGEKIVSLLKEAP